ncbi:hypothetical protein C2142_20245 [Streptomyces sp. CB01881]|nr:hypothetical protein C2142_20245 [Streptomyces sp. CB01881]
MPRRESLVRRRRCPPGGCPPSPPGRWPHRRPGNPSRPGPRRRRWRSPGRGRMAGAPASPVSCCCSPGSG